MTKKQIFLVTGATGRVGSKVARRLLAQGHGVHAFGRSAERLQPLADMGAYPVVGDMHDVASVKEAFRGIDAALLVGQGDRSARDYRRSYALAGENYAAAARATGLRSAVFVSSLGAHDQRHRGMVLIHGDVEDILNQVEGLNLVHLRAPVFIENLLYFLEPMQELNRLTWPIATDAPVDMGTTRDIAEAAVGFLTRRDWSGKKVVELLGRRVSLGRIAEVISRELGRPFPASPLGRDEDIEGMVAAGLSRDFATLMNDAWDSLSRGSLREGVGETVTLPGEITDFIRDEVIPKLGTSQAA